MRAAAILSVVFLTHSLALAQQANPATVDMYLDGLDAMEEGKWKVAEEAFTRVLQQVPSDARALLARGVTRLFEERLEEGKTDIEDSLRSGKQVWFAEDWRRVAVLMTGTPLDPPTDGFDGDVYRLARQYALGDERRAAAIAEFPHLAGQFARMAVTYADLALALRRRILEEYHSGKTAQAFRHYDSWSMIGWRTWDGDAELISMCAARAVAGEDWMDARELLTRLLTLRTDDSRVYLSRALVEAHLGNVRRARADLALAAKALPDEAATLHPAIEEVVKGLPEEPTVEDSMKQLRLLEVSAADPNTTEEKRTDLALMVTRITNGWRLRADERFQDGLRVREEALQADRESPDAHLALAQYLCEATAFGQSRSLGRPDGTIERAERELGAVLTRAPGCARALTWMAFCFFARRDASGAAAILDGLGAAHQDDVDVILVRASLARLARSESTARSLFERVLSRDPSRALAWEGVLENSHDDRTSELVKQAKQWPLKNVETKAFSSYDEYFDAWNGSGSLDRALANDPDSEEVYYEYTWRGPDSYKWLRVLYAHELVAHTLRGIDLDPHGSSRLDAQDCFWVNRTRSRLAEAALALRRKNEALALNSAIVASAARLSPSDLSWSPGIEGNPDVEDASTYPTDSIQKQIDKANDAATSLSHSGP